MDIKTWNYDVWTKCESWLCERGLIEHTADFTKTRQNVATAIATGALPADVISEIEAECAAAPSPKANLKFQKGLDPMTSTTTKSADPRQVFGGGSGNVKVKDPVAGFSTARTVGTHRKTGQPVSDGKGGFAELPSECDLAQLGAYVRRLAQRAFGSSVCELRDSDKALLASLENLEWAGQFDGRYERGLGTHLGVKAALLDDSASGGTEAAPIFFDQLAILTPLLSGEIFPHVQVIDVPRGRRIEGVTIENVTITSSTEGTAISLFNTQNFIAAFDHSLYEASFAMQIGLDFLSDSPLALGSIVQQLCSEKLMAWLDEQIMSGDGTTEPEGILVGSGSTAFTSDNGGTGPWSFGDYLDAHFSVPKVYRRQNENCGFFSNDTTFARSRAIKVDVNSPSTDQRPVMSTVSDVNTYMSCGWPHRIENNIGNRVLGFGAFKRYRLYRRLGMTFKFETGGDTLSRTNTGLFIMRSRWGGGMANPDAFAICQTGQV